MAIQDDFSISTNGDIRYTGTTTNYTVIALHRWLGDLMDDAQASGNDLLDITDATASERSTDNIITLKAPYNIDDVAAEHLYDGSIIQANGDTIYDGIVVFAPASTYLYVMQDGYLISPNFWTTGLNADSAQGISHRFMIKVRDSGFDIDSKKLIGLTREFGSTYSEFKINGTSRGNNVMALTASTDLNNQTSDSTVKGWTSILNTEGYIGLDVNGDTTNEFYYSDWDKDTFTINQFYERIKWLTRRSTSETSGTDTGSDFNLGDGTTYGQAQSFANGSNDNFLTRAFFNIKKVGSPTGSVWVKLYTHSGTFGTSSVPNGYLAQSVSLDVSKFTTSYQTTEFAFRTQYLLSASTNYVLVLEYTGGDGSNYLQIEGLASSGTAAGNRSSYDGGTWSATAGDDLNFDVYTSPNLYGISGERFRGITHEVSLTTPRTGTFSTVELVSWGSGATAGTGLMVAIDSLTAGTTMWIQLLTGVAPSASVTITGTASNATVTNTGTPIERSLSFPLCGASTGSAIIGSYGFGIEPSQLTASDKLFDLTNTQRTPPNNVTFSVLGLVSGEDRVLVGPSSGGVLLENQFTLAATYNSAGVTSIQVNTTIPSDTPSSGTIRIELDSGIYARITYTSYASDTFTISSTDFSSDSASSGNNTYISYIDKLAGSTTETFTGVYLSDRSLFVRVRDGGTAGDFIPIKTFETTGTLGSAGGSATVIRTSDV